jgi:alkylation response protein AidB-like acyl-CoA dehydrogenase
MTFELSSESLAVRDRARTFAQTLRERAAEIDRAAAVPADVSRELAAFGPADALTTVVMVEEIAVASAAVAAGVVAGAGAPGLGLSGLRGASAPEATTRSQLALAAIALGVGRAAVESALSDLRQSSGTPAEADKQNEKPQWLVADVATDLEAARLLTYRAAETMSAADVALARVLASAAAQRAVDTAVRIAGADALTEGSALDRWSRDVRVLSVLLGTEENHRAVAAEGLLPR